MPPLALGLNLILAAYLSGSIPFGLLCGWIVGGIDIRRHGSGNIGATNVSRLLGKKWGALVLGLDALKGFVPVSALAPLLVDRSNPDFVHWEVGAGIAAILGHMFPCWLGFRGGKGVATALGVIVWLGGWSTLVAAGVFAASIAVRRYVSLASILGAGAFAICQMARLRPAPFSAANWSLGAFSLIVPLLIVVRHRSNIGRLLRGEERPFQ